MRQRQGPVSHCEGRRGASQVPPPGWRAVAAVNYQSPFYHGPYFEWVPSVDQISVGQGKPILFTWGLRRWTHDLEFGARAVLADGHAIGQLRLSLVSPLQGRRREGAIVAEPDVLQAMDPGFVRRGLRMDFVEALASPIEREIGRAHV